MKKKTVILTIIGILLIVMVLIGLSFSLWMSETSQIKENLVDTGCLEITLTEHNDALVVENDYNNRYLLEKSTLKVGETKDYEFRQWVDESGTLNNSQNKRISTRIVIESSATTKYYKEELLADNDPVLNEGFIPVTIEENGTIKVADIYEEWYNYENKEWANAVVVSSPIYNDAKPETVIPMENIEQMYVWIPRYAYDKDSIVDAQHAIDITFVDKNTEAHPAFSVRQADLKGIWVGKFENGYEIDEEADSNTPYVIKPNINPTTIDDVENAFTKTTSLNNTNNNNKWDNLSEIHMLKNSEWNAVAFLSQSIYGVCSSATECEKVENNSYYNSNEYAVTGCGGNDEGILSEVSGIDICPVENRWTTENGMHASTTRNITGIYDMAGGNNEYVLDFLYNESNEFEIPEPIKNVLKTSFNDNTNLQKNTIA